MVEAINSGEERQRRGEAAYARYMDEFVGARVFTEFATRSIFEDKA